MFDYLRAGRSEDRIPVGDEIFRTRPDRPSYSAEVKEGVELHLYSPSGPSWRVIERILPLPLPNRMFTWDEQRAC